MRASDLIEPRDGGLWCEAGGFHVDPGRAVDKAIITHAHGDHCRPGHKALLATPETAAIAVARYGANAFGKAEGLPCAQPMRINDVTVTLRPAGHVLGSAQVVIEKGGARAVISGDYKREADLTCAPFEVVPCDLFVTEATFGLPVFRHPPVADEIARLLASIARFPDRTHLVGAYALGKAQRLIAELRRAGWDRTIWLHGALMGLCSVYEDMGIPLGPLEQVPRGGQDYAGEIVMAPPGALADRWSRKLGDVLPVAASGWMRVRQRAKQRGAELALVISDHADWDDLIRTITETGASEVWVTHGAEEALVHWCHQNGIAGKALRLVGRSEEAE
ncbi:MAG: ligase-associated DNA damage response exonuclease [Pseudomonadota bacterium]